MIARETARKALDEHVELKRLLGSIVRCVSSGPEYGCDVLDTLGSQLRELRENLEQHFAREERGGLFAGICEKVPTAQAQIDALKREHTLFLDGVDLLIERLVGMDAKRLGPVCDDVGTLVEDLGRHERSEVGLFQRAYYTDLGSPD